VEINNRESDTSGMEKLSHPLRSNNLLCISLHKRYKLSFTTHLLLRHQELPRIHQQPESFHTTVVVHESSSHKKFTIDLFSVHTAIEKD
jgi:hypothetical protein